MFPVVADASPGAAGSMAAIHSLVDHASATKLGVRVVSNQYTER